MLLLLLYYKPETNVNAYDYNSAIKIVILLYP